MKTLINFLRFKILPIFKINYLPSFYSSHSQFGEDMILRSILGNKRNGFYIDIGAHHPVYYSNTYHFYLKGWNGINIDAIPGGMKIFSSLRPRDINIEACISNKANDEVDFFEFSKPALNTFDKNYAENVIAKGELLLRKTTMRTKTLQQILEENNFINHEIDFLSIDIEGVDEVVLKSLDFDKIRPKVMVFEDHSFELSKARESELLSFLIGKDYKFAAKSGPSIIVVDSLHKFQ